MIESLDAFPLSLHLLLPLLRPDPISPDYSRAHARRLRPLRRLASPAQHVARSNSRTAAIALAALILYPIAVAQPMLKVQHFGHQNETSVLQGIITLLANGQLLVGLVVLLCSIVFPLGKLIALLAITSGRVAMANHHKVFTYRLIEWTGRWGMMDVLLVAILVAALKLGNMMEVTPGPAALAFSACVILSLLASASFNPHSVWETQR